MTSGYFINRIERFLNMAVSAAHVFLLFSRNGGAVCGPAYSSFLIMIYVSLYERMVRVIGDENDNVTHLEYLKMELG